MKFTYLFLLLSVLGFSQNEKQAIIIDEDDNHPIEFVSVYNGKDYTTSNEDGRFLFKSALDSIYFYTGGYEILRTTFQEVKDTVYLKKSVYELAEVVVTNNKSLSQKIKESILDNYPFEPYNENILLRGVLKLNDSIVRIQDIQAKLRRKTLLYTNNMEVTPDDYQVEITNMRKIGILMDDKDAYFIFPSFNNLLLNFIPYSIDTDVFNSSQKSFDNGQRIKWEFNSKDSESTETTDGNYIINASDYAFEYFEINKVNEKNNYKVSNDIKYRTANYQTKVYFTKDKLTNKYVINYAKYNTRLEVTDAKNSFTSFYDLEFILTTSDNFKPMKIKSNINESTDIFKLHHRYRRKFWNQENQLLLTDEMNDFIQKLKKNRNQFQVKSNF